MKFIYILFIFFSQLLIAQEIIPGLIPRYYSIPAASDLEISPEQAHRLAVSKKQDISKIEPLKGTNIWDPQNTSITQNYLINQNEKVEFLSELPSRRGMLRFNIKTQDSKDFIVILSKKIHNILLRKNILEKLGYKLPKMTWLPKLRIRFKNTVERDLFFIEMKDKLLADPKRWIKTQDELEVTIQDILIQETNTNIYNLSSGLMPSGVHQGRRILRAPYIPLSLVDTHESANLTSWVSGRLIKDQIKLYHTQDLKNTFDTSWEDARWIARKISQFKRSDFQEIIEKSHFPISVEKLLLEKFISRRNHLLNLLQIKNTPLTFNPQVEFGDSLKDGEIIQEFFPGYVSRFSFGDPESPFSASEIGYFALSKAQSALLSEGVSKLNQLLGTSVEKNIQEKIQKIILDEGPFFSTKALNIPTVQGNLILSRDVIAGSYLGTNHRVQLVDNFGVNAEAGGIVSLVGSNLPIGFQAGSTVSVQRLFSHVKPLKSLKKSMKEPYKNMMVNFLTRKFSKAIDELSITDDDNPIAINKVLSLLKSSIKIGESLIITDSIIPSIETSIELSLSQFFFLPPDLLKAYARNQTQKLVVKRFHFFRASDDLFHIYQDTGKGITHNLSVKLKSHIPIISFHSKWKKLSAQTNFFHLLLQGSNTEVSTLKALRQSLLTQKTHWLKEKITPHRLEHSLKEKNFGFNLLFFKYNKIKSSHNLTAKHAQGGYKRNIFRKYDAFSIGSDYENYVIEIINDNLDNFLNYQIQLAQNPSLNAGFSIKGKSQNRIFMSELEEEHVHTRYQHVFVGWKSKNQSLLKKMKKLNKIVGEELFDPLVINNTDSIRLYQISLQVILANEAMLKLSKTSLASFKSLISKNIKNIQNIKL